MTSSPLAESAAVSCPLSGNDLAAIQALLDTIPDPEIPVISIRELGILRAVERQPDGTLDIVITPTYSGCPAIGQIEDDIRATLLRANLTAKVTTRLSPAWTTDWMTPAAHEKLKAYGIAPPASRTVEPRVIQFASKSGAYNAYSTRGKTIFNVDTVSCPRCGSADTTETSHFASTACKALYRCLTCLEPFDYFKPH